MAGNLVADTPDETQGTSPYAVAEAFGTSTLRRIDWLTITLGAAGAVWAARYWGWRGGVGVALGAALSWINFRWLKSSVRAFGAVAPRPPQTAPAGSLAAGNPDAPPVSIVRVPLSAYAKFFGRFALLLGVVYVILTRSWLPALPVITGLFAAAGATVLALVFELAMGRRR